MNLLRKILETDPGIKHFNVLAFNVGASWLEPAAWLDNTREGRDQALLVGGPDGLAPECTAKANLKWSLSPLTLPHGLVRVVLDLCKLPVHVLLRPVNCPVRQHLQ